MDESADKSGLFNRVRESFKGGARPGFLGGEGGGEVPSGSKAEKKASERAKANGAAADSLKGAEDSAGGGLYHREDSLDGAREGEARPGGFYSGGGLDKASRTASAAKDIKRGNFKGAFKKAGPITGIFLVIFLVGGIMAGTQVFQPFSLVAQFQESFNSMHTSVYNRSARIIRWQMDNGRLKDPVKGTIFGNKKFAISKKQIAEFEKQGIKYNDAYETPDGKKIKVLEYETEGGQKRIVTADADTASNLRSNGVMALSIDAAYNDTTFSHKFTSASQTWRGQFANWFGTKTGEFLKTNKLTRNMFKDWKTTKTEAEASGKTSLEAVKDTIKKRINDGEGGGVSRRVTGKDEEGNTIVKGDPEVTNGSKVDSKKVKEKLNSIKGSISGGANIGCAVADFVGVVNLMVAAQEAAQIINITTAYMEAVDKTKAGYGNEAPINELAETLNEQVKTDHEKIVYDGGGQTVDDDGESSTVYAKSELVEGKTKSAMQSAGMAALFGNGLTDPNDVSVQSFNLTSSSNTLLGGIGMSMSSFTACAIGRAVTATASATMDLILCASTAGAACAASLLKDLAIGATVALAIQGVIEILTPWLTSVLERDLVSTLAGEDLGNALTSGANMYQGYVHKANGGSLSTREKYEEFAITQQQVVAENAKEERENLSPFDLTSKNTFMGSIMTQLMTLNTSNSLMSALTSASSAVSSSIVATTPSTSAIASQIAETLPTMEEYEQVCPYLASIGAIGDSFCNPYMVTDMSTMDEDPADVIESISDQFEDQETSDGNVKIKKDSDLMKYIKYCGNRTSAFGVADQSIISDVKLTTGNSTADTIIGAAPIMGDLVDVFDAMDTAANVGYISGESCVAGNNLRQDVPAAEASPAWNRAKQYQRFIEDQSLAESMGIIEKSAVSVALEEYYEENPVDESYEGQLARWSGLSKDTVTDLLDIIAYYNYVSNYDASERYAFGAPVIKEDGTIQFNQEDVMGNEAVALEGIVYADVRNRTFVI